MGLRSWLERRNASRGRTRRRPADKERHLPMAYGPVEMLVVKFPGNQFTGELAPALQDLVDTGLIRVIDLLFVLKDSDGEVLVYEQNGWGDEVAAVFEPLVQPEDELLSQ